MKRNPYFLLREINGQAFLLPFGQGIADHQRGVSLSESGVYLWEALEQEKTRDELLALFASHYEASEEELPQLSADLDLSLAQLLKSGALLSGEDPWAISAPYFQTLEIASLRLRLEGPSEAFSEGFAPFSVHSGNQAETSSNGNRTPILPDMTVTAFAGICPYKNPGNLILRNSMLTILDCGYYYELEFLANEQVRSLILKKDGSKAIFYYAFPHNDLLREELFHGIREAFLYLAGLHGMVAIHSTSILYQGKAWLFSGHSGMGKSTHARLWQDTFGVPLLNGDLNLLGEKEGKPYIFGIPWCGTSGIFDTKAHPLGGIILLKRDQTNHVKELSPAEQVLLVDQRLISHSWTEALFDANLSLIQKIAPELLICSLYCTKDPEAAIVMRSRIELYLNV